MSKTTKSEKRDGSSKPTSDTQVRDEAPSQEYGDLTELNRGGILLTSIGRQRLESLADDYLELLEIGRAHV